MALRGWFPSLLMKETDKPSVFLEGIYSCFGAKRDAPGVMDRCCAPHKSDGIELIRKG